MHQPELIIIDTQRGIEHLAVYLKDKEYVAYDCETTGLSPSDKVIGFSICAEEDRAFYVILNKWENDSLLSLDLDPTEILKELVDKQLVMHNAVFDCMMAESNFKCRLIDSLHTDTMILAHLLDENRKIGLKPLAAQLFGDSATREQEEMKGSIIANGGSATKTNYELYKADAYLIARYGAKDAWLTYKLFLELVPELYEQKLDKFFYEDESMPLLRGPTYDLNTTGLQVDTQRLLQLKKQLQAECLEAKAFIYQEIDAHIKHKYPGDSKKTTFNIGSGQQLAWLLFGQLGLEFGTLTKEGKNVCKALGLKLPYTPAAKRDFIATCSTNVGRTYQCESYSAGAVTKGRNIKDPWAYIMSDKKILQKHAQRYKWIEKLLEYNRKKKLLNTYVEGIEERIKYGIIRPSFHQAGTTSGRYASRDPNFQNLPRDDKRIKEAIVPRPGRSFVGADYSQLEPRVFAYVSQDQTLASAFSGATDFYSVIGMEVYDILDVLPIKDGSPSAFGIKHKRLRDNAKVIALASTYGATAFQLAPTTGKSVDDTQEDIDKYFEKFPKVKLMMLESHEMAKKTGQVSNLFGRPRRMPEAKRITKLYGNASHAKLPYEARNLLNLAVNHRIQSTGASIVNRAAILFYKNCKLAGIDCKLVLQVHDSLVVECEEADAENVAILL
jgi:DNA polymerase I-like protein with 3'-5' exonuclease and polymerase domains